MSLIRWLILVLLIACVMPVSARMYQWTDPKTGITQLAGMPPPWYRSARGGPRVFVFENGRLIDDTSIKVPDAERVQLRQQAMIQASGDKGKSAKRLQGAAQVEAALGAPTTAAEQPPRKAPQKKPPAPKPPQTSAPQAAANQAATPSVEQMRQLIQRWEAAQEQNARRQADIQSPPPASGP